MDHWLFQKTLADWFKFRPKLGMDSVLEALKLYKARSTDHCRALILAGPWVWRPAVWRYP